MNIEKRNKDLTEVFNQTYKANNNYKKINENKQKTIKALRKMYNLPPEEEKEERVKSTREITLERINEKLEALNRMRNNK